MCTQFKNKKEMENKTKYNDIDMIEYAHYILNNDVISPEEWVSRYKTPIK